MKTFIKEIKKHANLYTCPRTGLAWIENGTTGTKHTLHANIYDSGSVRGMKQSGYWRKEDRTVKTNGFIYNVDTMCNDDNEEFNFYLKKYCQCPGCSEKKAADDRQQK